MTDSTGQPKWSLFPLMRGIDIPVATVLGLRQFLAVSCLSFEIDVGSRRDAEGATVGYNLPVFPLFPRGIRHDGYLGWLLQELSRC